MTRYVAEAYWDYDGVVSDGNSAEVRVCPWWDYSRCGDVVILRHPDTTVRNRMIHAAVEICRNDDIGYSMNQRRYTGFYAIRDVGWNPSRIKDVGGCDLDCSEMMAVCVNCGLGYEAVDMSNWTGTQRRNLEAVGFHEADDLMPGDIILAHNGSAGTGHTGMYIGESPEGDYYEEDEMFKDWCRFICYELGGQWLYAAGRFQGIGSEEDLNVLTAAYGWHNEGREIPYIECDAHWIDVMSAYFEDKPAAQGESLAAVLEKTRLVVR